MAGPEGRINSLISDIKYPMNVGGIIRTSHVLGGGELYIHDPRRVLQELEEEVRRFSSNIYDLHEFKMVEDLFAFLREYPGRKIATALNEDSVPVTEFDFKEGDLVILGNERVGLPSDVIAVCDESIIIPMLGAAYEKTDYNPGQPITGVGQYPSLNVSVAHAIATYTALEQLGAFEGYKFSAISPQPLP